MDVRRMLVVVAIAVAVAGCAAPVGTDPAAPAPIPTLPPTLPAAPNGVDLPLPPPAATPTVDEPGGNEPGGDEPGRTAGAPVVPPDIAGYTGDRWAAALSGEVRLLDDTLSLRDGVVRGLVRNEASYPVGPVTVAVGESKADAALPVLRPGEPAPFEVALDGPDTGNASMEDVEVVVTAASTAARPSRAVRLSTFWRRGIADDRPVDTYLFRDPAMGPRPAVAFGEVLAAEAVDGLVVVAAWVDAEGRVLAVDAAADVQAEAVEAGGALDFVVAADGPPALDAAVLVLWGSGS